MTKVLSSFRAKMIFIFGLSMLLAGIITYLLFKGLQLYYRNSVRAEDSLALIRHFISKIGDINFFLLIFVPLSILIFFILTKPYSTYFKKISSAIHHLASGDFTSIVHISSKDEFGDIAKDINRASEKLQEAVKRGDFAENSKDQLVVNLAHDLRTPLTSILGYLDLILTDEKLSKEQIHHFSSIAYTKSQRLEKLIDELFELTRVNYGLMAVHKTQIDMGELLIQIAEELFPSLEKNHLATRINLNASLVISGDGELLARVFENLLTNAIRYGADGQFIDMNGFMDGDAVVVQIINYGNTISPEDLPHLFDSFYTGDQARTYQGGGTGLGLFIAKNIIEQHNGTISAESSLLRTVFEIRLPLTE